MAERQAHNRSFWKGFLRGIILGVVSIGIAAFFTGYVWGIAQYLKLDPQGFLTVWLGIVVLAVDLDVKGELEW